MLLLDIKIYKLEWFGGLDLSFIFYYNYPVVVIEYHLLAEQFIVAEKIDFCDL